MKRGQTAPWQTRITFEGQPEFKRSHPDEWTARFHARESLRAGAAVTLWHKPAGAATHQFCEELTIEAPCEGCGSEEHPTNMLCGAYRVLVNTGAVRHPLVGLVTDL